MKGIKRQGRRFPWLFLATGTGLLVTGFITVYYLAFPQAAMQQRLEYELASRSPYSIHLQQASLHPPLTLALEQVTIQNLPDDLPSLDLQQVKIRPRWLSLLTGTPGVIFDATMEQARVTGSWQRDGQVAINIWNLPLSPWLPKNLGLTLSGIAKQATLQAQLSAPSQPPENSQLRIEVSDLALGGLQKFGLNQDQIRFGTAHIVTSSKNGKLNIEQLTITEGDLDISVSGSILLATPLPRSHLNLTLSLRPGRSLDPAATELLLAMAKPNADGSVQIRITGTAAHPKLQ